jgi:hypothetical protein
VPDRRGSDDLFPCPQGGANRAPLAPAKVLRADASIPTRRRSSRAPQAGASTVATTSRASRGAAKASGSRLATSTVEPRQAAEEARQEPAMAEAQPVAEAQPAAPVVVALLASSAMGVRQAPAAAEALPETAVAAPQQESAAAVAQPAAEVIAPPQEPALACSSQATAVEIPTTTPRRPGGTSGEAYPHQPPSLRRGRSSDGGTATWWPGARGTPSRPLPPTLLPGPSGPAAGPGQGQEHVDAPSPLFIDAQEEQQLWEELRGHGASFNRVLNEALQIHGGPAWHVLQV